VRELSAARVSEPEAEPVSLPNNLPPFRVLLETERQQTPVVSIITTIYDRVNLLAGCLESVRELVYRDFEHIIVSDHPPEDVVSSIQSLLSNEPAPSLTYADLNARANNWGIAPASVGLHLARGRYVCFLSDDNGYTPDHFDPLVSVLEQNSDIAFAYSSCQYAGRFVLRNSTPLPGGIDLGQPLFRKEIFDRYLPGALPFDMMAWDWHMIERFMHHGLRWHHVDRPTFLFRLAACSQNGFSHKEARKAQG
jgi:glycosyltransferase involved in cell wall biosynthesis